MAHKARPLEILQLEEHLASVFGGLLPPSTNVTDPLAAQNDFNSRALAAFALMKACGCDAVTAAAGIVDGKNDGGIDAIHLDHASRLWIVQSKWYRSGRGIPSQGDLEKFATGVDDVLTMQFKLITANPRFAAVIPRLRHEIEENDGLKVYVVVVYTGDRDLGSLQTRPLDRLKTQFSQSEGYLTTRNWKLSDLHEFLVGASRDSGVERITLELLDAGFVDQPYKVVFGRLRLRDVAEMVEQHKEKLIAANIRTFLGDTPINNRLLKTLENEPGLFFYLNNGLVAYCSSYRLANPTVSSAITTKRLRANDFCIINGAQTAWAIAEFFRRAPSLDPDGYVFLRLISLDQVPDAGRLATAITEASNFQNAVKLQDLAALRPEQERLAAHLRWSGIHYHTRIGADTPTPDQANFTIDEAVTALACLSGRVELTSLILSDRQRLYSADPGSFDGVDGAETTTPASNYAHVFAPHLTAREVWRAVQIQRCVAARCDENAAQATARTAELYQHGRWLVLQAVLAGGRDALFDVEDLALSAADAALARQAVDQAGLELERVLQMRSDALEKLFAESAECRAVLKAILPGVESAFALARQTAE